MEEMKKTAAGEFMSTMGRNKPKLEPKQFPVLESVGAPKEHADAYWNQQSRELAQKANQAAQTGGGEQYSQAYAKRHKALEPWKYDREFSESVAAKAQQQAEADFKAHSGWWQGMKNGYTSSRAIYGRDFAGRNSFLSRLPGPIRPDKLAMLPAQIRDMWLARHYVDKDWLDSIQQTRSDDPLEVIRNTVYRDTVNRKALNELNTLSRQEAAAAHLEGQLADSTIGTVVNPILRHLPGQWRSQDISQKLTGRTTDEHAMDYQLMSMEDFGEEAGRRAAQWLRGAGVGVYGAGAVVSTLAGGAMLKGLQGAGAALNAARAAKNTSTALVPVAKGVQLWRGGQAFNAANMGFKMAQPISRGAAALRVLGNGTVAALKSVPGTQRVAGGLHALSQWTTEAGQTQSKWRQGAGTVLDMADTMYRYSPGFTMGTTALGALGTATGATQAMANLTARIPGARWATSVTDITGRPVTGFLEAASKAAYRGVGKDIAAGVKMGLINDAISLSEGNKPQGSILGRYSPFVMGQAIPAVASPVMSRNDNLATMLHSGKALEAQTQSIEALMADPAQAQAVKTRLGDPNMTDATLRELLPDVLAAERQERVMEEALHVLDKDYDWAGASPEDYRAKWNSFTPEQKADALYGVYRNDAVMGGYISPAMFADRNLTQDQRRNLLKLYIQSEDNATGGTLVGQAVRGGQKVALDALKNSPRARKAVVGYAQGLVRDMLDNPSKPGGMDIDEDAKAILNALDATERRQIMEPLMKASASQIMALQKNMKTTASSPLAQAGEEAIMDRLRTDGNFAAEFLPEYTKGLQDGTGIGSQDSSRMLAFVKSMDPEALISSMDDDKFHSFARWAMDGSKGGMLDDLPEDTRNELMARFTDAAKGKVQSMLKANPLKNLPLATSMWLSSRGWKGLGAAMDNPFVFYGTLALLLGGVAWLGGGLFGDTGPDDAIVDNQQAVQWSEKQRELLMRDLRI